MGASKLYYMDNLVREFVCFVMLLILVIALHCLFACALLACCFPGPSEQPTNSEAAKAGEELWGQASLIIRIIWYGN